MSLGQTTYRLRFLCPPTERGAPVLAETTVRATNVEGQSDTQATPNGRPAHNRCAWSILDGQQVYEQLKAGRG